MTILSNRYLDVYLRGERARKAIHNTKLCRNGSFNNNRKKKQKLTKYTCKFGHLCVWRIEVSS